MVKPFLTFALVLFVAGLAAAADPGADRKVRVALALCGSQDGRCQKVQAALASAIPKSKETKVSEAPVPISTAPMPREVTAAAPCDCCGPACQCSPCDCLTYAAAYERAAKGARVVFTAEAGDPTRPPAIAPGRYEFWTDASGFHHRAIPDPAKEPPNVTVPLLRPMPFLFAPPGCRT